ncbi:hypothetical protein EB796_010389 [Bugula neritina]|uniref:Uncharacterized protein n=1 Tax=Bugula neritina TaxID=10212 RepID=A0A7J7K054_BUGNE|nr:hypothetical protein EB796_010389 [Bugula neritina]
MGENLVRGDNSYTVLKAPSLKSKVGSKKNSSKKKDKGTYSTHTGDDEVDFGSFHFGLAREEFVPQYEPATHDDEINQLMNQNFLIGRPGVQNEARQKSRQSFFSEIESGSVSASGLNIRRSSDSQRPVLPSDISADKTKLKPTVLNIKTKRQSEITPELDLKLKMRQKESEETILNPLAPRSVVNPLAETHPEHNRKLYISPTPGPISKMSTSLPFNPSAALPQSSWHESVIGNFKSKEKIENRLTSQMVDAKELPKMKSDKKQSEIENLFSNVNLEKVETQNMGEENFAMTGSSPMNRLHEAMGFMP